MSPWFCLIEFLTFEFEPEYSWRNIRIFKSIDVYVIALKYYIRSYEFSIIQRLFWSIHRIKSPSEYQIYGLEQFSNIFNEANCFLK